MKSPDPMYSLSKGVESLSKEEHGRFFDAMQILGLSNEVKQAAVVVYLEFKSRPIGQYTANRKNLDIFLIASISLAAKVLGELRTDQEFESKMFVRREGLADAEERILSSFRVQDNVMPLPGLLLRLARRQVESMAENFAERELIGAGEKQELVQRSYNYLDAAVGKGLNPKMGYRGRAAAVMLIAVRDLGLHISEIDIARAAGFDKKSMKTNANVIAALLQEKNDAMRNSHAGAEPSPENRGKIVSE